ncbi:transcription factor EGL1-like isoform X2 [Rhodamnia argentea]|uniref:Transcription factor EGL1-like isoform X2 n=1 Tax=Rhodamnia argentea TaxID=178133 RepID=A0A8B8PV48_9MYRT|nr:transcription factor EGL1-like isoform X2 [Rhodamnia argentea]
MLEISAGVQHQGTIREHLKEQLALAVRNIQWTYAIFWSISAAQPGVLEWGGGYYNGDIKTRRTTQAIELGGGDHTDLHRSEQLRELYESLSGSKSNPQPSRRPSVALSPEDLADTEWYYLVCMSFIFNIGQCLPGQSLATGKLIWLCNAHCADSKVFSRSLLAKSASIQTVVCFQFLDGIIELGTTELVLEDPNLIRHVKTSLLKSSDLKGSEKPDPCAIDNRSKLFDRAIFDTGLISGEAEEGITSLNTGSNGLEPNQQLDDSCIIGELNGVASQLQSWQIQKDEFSYLIHQSGNSRDSISQSFLETGTSISIPNLEKSKDHWTEDLQECNNEELDRVDLRGDGLHYRTILSSILETSNQLRSRSHCECGEPESSFIGWKKGQLKCHRAKGVPQKLLKRILLEVPQLHARSMLDFSGAGCKRDGIWMALKDELSPDRNLSGSRQNEKISEQFCVLNAVVPSVKKVDKVSILDDTIEYVKELQRRVEELQSSRISSELLAISGGKPQESTERTSDNCGNLRTGLGKQPVAKKRKAHNYDMTDTDSNYLRDGPIDNLSVSVNDEDVLIEMRCVWREGVILEIIEALSHSSLDSHSVQSSTSDGILSVTIKSKLQRSTTTKTTAASIKQALQGVAQKC